MNQLVLVNRGKRPVLLLAGELVSGGKQDRIIAKDRIVAPGADPLPLDVFCVEHGRWSSGSNSVPPKPWFIPACANKPPWLRARRKCGIPYARFHGSSSQSRACAAHQLVGSFRNDGQQRADAVVFQNVCAKPGRNIGRWLCRRGATPFRESYRQFER